MAQMKLSKQSRKLARENARLKLEISSLKKRLNKCVRSNRSFNKNSIKPKLNPPKYDLAVLFFELSME